MAVETKEAVKWQKKHSQQTVGKEPINAIKQKNTVWFEKISSFEKKILFVGKSEK